jgi:hypothetical protein
MNNQDIFETAKLEYTLVQQQIDKYDEVAHKVKSWAVVLWVVIFGWSVQFDKPTLLLINCYAVIVFFLLDSINKNLRQDHRRRRVALAEALQKYGQTGAWPENFVTPEAVKHSSAGVLKEALEPPVVMLYLPLAAIALIGYFLQQ